jgi:tetratricopeptide (TPR) repeat protein
VTAQLYRMKEEAPVWAEAFETTGSDILSVQRQLAGRLAGSLSVAALLQSPAPPSTAAQEQLAKARYLRNKNEPAALRSSVEAFEKARDLDPENATIWSELAMAYEASAGILPAREALDKSCAAAKRARELSNREALADTALGLCAMQRDWDWAGAEAAFGSALVKNPGLAATHHTFAAFLSAAGRHREALDAIARAKSLDPLSPAVVSDAGWHAYLARDYAAAERVLARTLALAPADAWSREHLMMSKALARDVDGAAEQAALWAAMFPLTEEEKTSLRGAPPSEVVRRTSLTIANRLAARVASGHPANAGFVALKYAGAAEEGETLDWLERGATERSPWFLPILRDPRLDFVREHPRFLAIVARTHLPAGPASRN